MRTVNGDLKASNERLPEERIIDTERITDSEDIAQKLNKYFTSLADILNKNDSDTPTLNTEKISFYVDNKIPKDTFFTSPFITPEQVMSYINNFDCAKATGLDGIGPRILKIAAYAFSQSIAMLINGPPADKSDLTTKSEIVKVIHILKLLSM